MRLADLIRAALVAAVVVAAVPADALATGYTLRPSSTISNGWANLDGATAHAALSDAVTQPTAPATGAGSGYISGKGNGPVAAEVGLPDQTLGALETVASATAWAYVQPGSKRSITIELKTGATVLGTTTLAIGSAAQWISASTTNALTQTELNGLTIRISYDGTGGSTAAYAYAAYLQLQTRNFVMSTSAAPSFSRTLNGRDQTASYTAPVSLEDTRSPASGWKLTITSTQFTTGGGTPRTLPASASAVTGVAASCTVTPCVNPTTTVTYPVTVPAGSTPPAAVTFANAQSATGTGTFDLTPTVGVTIPGNAFVGTYTSTLTITLASGP